MRLEWIQLLPVLGVLLHGQAPAKPLAGTRSAIVCQLEGQASLHRPSQGKRDLALYDWLPAGAQVETGASSRLGLVFAGGQRFEMGENSRAKVGTAGLIIKKGQVQKKESLPMIPSMARTTVATAKGRPGSVTVRRPGPPLPWYAAFHPPADGAVLAEAATLSFQPLEAGGRFEVRVVDATGATVYSQEGDAVSLPLAPRLLKPGAWYSWSVRPLDQERGRPLEARFWAVQAGHALVRARLQADVDRSGDPVSKALLEAMDRWLGLAR